MARMIVLSASFCISETEIYLVSLVLLSPEYNINARVFLSQEYNCATGRSWHTGIRGVFVTQEYLPKIVFLDDKYNCTFSISLWRIQFRFRVYSSLMYFSVSNNIRFLSYWWCMNTKNKRTKSVFLDKKYLFRCISCTGIHEK